MDQGNWGPPVAFTLGRDFKGLVLLITLLAIKRHKAPCAYYPTDARWAYKHLFYFFSTIWNTDVPFPLVFPITTYSWTFKIFNTFLNSL